MSTSYYLIVTIIYSEGQDHEPVLPLIGAESKICFINKELERTDLSQFDRSHLLFQRKIIELHQMPLCDIFLPS